MLFSQAEFAAANSRWRLLTGFLFEVAAKLKAHGGKNFAGEIVFAPRSEALIKRGGEHRSGSGGLDCRQNGPAAFSGIRYAAGETFQRPLFEKRNGPQIHKARRDNATPLPNLRRLSPI